MSVNLGSTVSSPVTVTPSPKTMTLTATTQSITGTNNVAVDVSAAIGSMTMSSLAAQVNEDVIVRPGAGSMSMTSQATTVDFTPGQGNVTVDVGTDALLMSELNGSVYQPVTIATINNFTIAIDQTIDLISLYVTDPLGLVTDSQVIGITALATYTHAGGLVGVAEGDITGVTLEVTYT